MTRVPAPRGRRGLTLPGLAARCARPVPMAAARRGTAADPGGALIQSAARPAPGRADLVQGWSATPR